MIRVESFAKVLKLTQVTPAHSDTLPITSSDINRPGLQFAGFWDFFAYERPQVLGKVEMTYLEYMEEDVRQAMLEKFFGYHLPCVIICRGIDCPEDMKQQALKGSIPVFTSPEATTKVELDAINFLNAQLAPRITRHGVLVDVYGTGIFITGDSGVGKSEAALELVKRGHRLVADDVVDIRRVAENRLVGEAPEMVRHFMEIRGIGIIDISALYGVSAVIHSKSIELVVHLELWKQDKDYDRLGLTAEFANILGVRVPKLEIPIRPGRNLAVVLEVAARNFRLKQQGYNAAKELDSRLSARLARIAAEEELNETQM